MLNMVLEIYLFREFIQTIHVLHDRQLLENRQRVSYNIVINFSKSIVFQYTSINILLISVNQMRSIKYLSFIIDTPHVVSVWDVIDRALYNIDFIFIFNSIPKLLYASKSNESVWLCDMLHKLFVFVSD